MSPVEEIQHFLVVYDIESGSAEVETFGTDYESALEAYAGREREHRFDASVEIVLLGADSLDTVKKTHSSYFLNPDEHAFAGLIRSAAARR